MTPNCSPSYRSNAPGHKADLKRGRGHKAALVEFGVEKQQV